jgi:hypothetical protein
LQAKKGVNQGIRKKIFAEQDIKTGTKWFVWSIAGFRNLFF